MVVWSTGSLLCWPIELCAFQWKYLGRHLAFYICFPYKTLAAITLIRSDTYAIYPDLAGNSFSTSVSNVYQP